MSCPSIAVRTLDLYLDDVDLNVCDGTGGLKQSATPKSAMIWKTPEKLHLDWQKYGKFLLNLSDY